MKIMIPVDDDRRSVCVSFARAPYWLVHDSEANTTEAVENPAAYAEGGAGPKAAQFVLDCEADAVITVRCGENAAKVLQAGEVAIYKNISLLVTKMHKNRIERITMTISSEEA